MTNSLASMLAQNPVIPVVTLQNADDGVKLAEALLEGGISVIEITLRTEAGLEAIRQVAKHVKGMIVGAGTITTPDQFKQAVDAGSQFIVSPGLTDTLANGVLQESTPFLPGVSTTTEIMIAREYGLEFLKFFPASLSGGAAAIKQFGGLFPDIRFCPTGGINLDNFNDYLRLKNVVCVGGSWVSPDSLINNANWGEITRLSQEALKAVKC
ncbi:MAG: bifunctional 4-hydroxy-2-oxoglutarate aldolase/2-dehydro-3-deoxy-phosphogluconate aldolase [Alphaproteobacteria bacterium]|nr:bifunctional 4-hydroxy-2-oxoglutarate aldolase/2-dehydro-3-deoxy-phosphogluconate aldolase [Alphaproteobacteria bacterium]